MTGSEIRAVAPTVATALVGGTVVGVAMMATEWAASGWAWLLAVAGLAVISAAVSWWRRPRQTRAAHGSDGGRVPRSIRTAATRVAGPQVETVRQPERAAAAVVTPLTTGGGSSPGAMVGRDHELTALLALLDPRPGAPAGMAVSVVSGVAGVGKTALATQAARTAMAQGWFPGGVLVVDLHGDDSDPAGQVAPERAYVALLRALDPGRPLEDLPVTVDEQAGAYHQLMSQLDQPVLLVLDNAATTDQVTGLLPAGGAHRVLITSRYPLAELPGARQLELDVLSPELAVELLGARRPGDPRLGADPEAAAELADLCGQLPLALQAIAVLLAEDPGRPTADLVTELTEATTRLPSQQWPGRAALELSYGRLDDALAGLFRLLARAPGTDLAAPAVAVLIDQPVARVRPSLAALTRAHLLEYHQPERWRMHERLRSFAAELGATELGAAPAENQAIARLLGHYRDTTHAAAQLMSTQRLPAQRMAAQQGSHGFDTVADALDWLRAERANLVAAVTRAAGAPAHREYAIDIALGLAQFLDRERYLEDWAVTATTAAHAATELDDHYRQGAALNNLGSALTEVGRFEEAITSYHQAAETYRELCNHHGEGKALNNLGSALAEVGRFEEAITSHRQAADLYQQLGDQYGEGRARGNLGLALIQVHRMRAARQALERASTLFVEQRAYADADRVGALLTTLND